MSCIEKEQYGDITNFDDYRFNDSLSTVDVM